MIWTFVRAAEEFGWDSAANCPPQRSLGDFRRARRK
jgi:hypothetical protein